MVCQIFHYVNRIFIHDHFLNSFLLTLIICCFSTCFEGQWACKSLPKPATCAVEEGSHVTTFDGKTYTFHGECYYTLAKVESKVNGSSFCPIKWQKINNELMLNIFSFYLIPLTLCSVFFRMMQVQNLPSWLSWHHVQIRSLTLVLRLLKSCWTMTEIMWVEMVIWKTVVINQSHWCLQH